MCRPAPSWWRSSRRACGGQRGRTQLCRRRSSFAWPREHFDSDDAHGGTVQVGAELGLGLDRVSRLSCNLCAPGHDDDSVAGPHTARRLAGRVLLIKPYIAQLGPICTIAIHGLWHAGTASRPELVGARSRALCRSGAVAGRLPCLGSAWS